MIEFRPGKQLVYYDGAEAQSPVQQAVAWWDAGYAAYDFTAATYTLAKGDLTGNLRHATDGAAFPSHIPGVGCVFNGVQYLVTPIQPTLDQTWSAIIKFNSITSGIYLFGSYVNSSPFPGMFANRSTRGYRSGTNFVTVPGDVASGTMAIAARRCYLNGLFEATIPIGVLAGNALVLFVGGVNASGVLTSGIAGIVSSFIVYDHTRSDAQILATSVQMP